MRKGVKEIAGLLLSATLVLGMVSGLGMNAYAAETDYGEPATGEGVTQTDSNEHVGYGVTNSKGFDIWGYDKDNNRVQTTFSEAGYLTQMAVSNDGGITFGSKYNLQNSSNPKFTFGKEYENEGVRASIVAKLETDSVVLTYSVKNVSDEKKIVKIGSSADIQIGYNDKAPVSFVGGNGIKMEDGSGNVFALIAGDGEFTTRWVGNYSNAESNVFNTSEVTEYKDNQDSGIAWSWTIELDPGQTVIKSAAPAEGELNIVTVDYDGNGGTGKMDGTSAICAEETKMSLSKNGFEKEGYYFMGWATSADGEAIYEDGAVIDVPEENTTLYAVWEKYRGHVITASDVEIKYGESGSIGATTDGEGELTYKLVSGDDVIELDEKTGAIKAKKLGEAKVTVTAGANLFYLESSKDIKVTVKEVEKKDLEASVKDANDYYDSIKDSNKETAEALKKAIDAATAVKDKKDVDANAVAEAYKALTTALETAKAEVKAAEDAKKAEETKPSNEWIDGQWYDADGGTTYDAKGEWKCNSSGWWFEDSNGWYPNDQWQKIDGKWYYFKADGYLDYSEYRDGCWLGSDGAWVEEYYGGTWKSDSTGWWFEDASGWYPTSQWVWINGSCYYFGADGYMLTNQYVDGYWVGADGASQ